MSTTLRSPAPVNHRSLVGVAAALTLAVGIGSAVTFGGSDATVSAPTSGELLRSLDPEARRYVEWVMSATPEQLEATFGTDSVGTRPPLKPGANAR